MGTVLVAGLAWVAGWGYSERPGSGGGVGDLDLILLTIRDEDEFDANTTLFSGSVVESMIDSTLGPLALWDLTTESMPAEGTFRHRLEFSIRVLTVPALCNVFSPYLPSLALT